MSIKVSEREKKFQCLSNLTTSRDRREAQNLLDWLDIPTTNRTLEQRVDILECRYPPSKRYT